MPNRKGNLCGPNISEPDRGRECLEAVWSVGRACKRCRHESCYRVGWPKWLVDADNKKRVHRNAEGPKDGS